jgi:hypothetical protein
MSVTIIANGAGSSSTALWRNWGLDRWFLTRGFEVTTCSILSALEKVYCSCATAMLLVSQERSYWAQKQDRSRRNSLAMWRKGESGNPAGRKRKARFDDHLREALAAKRGATAKALVQRLIGEAIQGNVPALKLICERVGGKPKSAEEIAAGNSEAMTLEQVRAKLAELLARPEVRRNLQAMLTESKPETDTVQ